MDLEQFNQMYAVAQEISYALRVILGVLGVLTGAVIFGWFQRE